MWKICVETMLLCLMFFGLIYAYVAKDRKGGLHWYPKHVQKEAIKRNLITEKEIQKRAKQSKIVISIVVLITVLVFVYVINQVKDYPTAFIQFVVMLLGMNWFDAIVVDYIWVTKTNYWVIEELKDLPDIGKPMHQIRQERIKSSLFLIVMSAILACITFLV